MTAKPPLQSPSLVRLTRRPQFLFVRDGARASRASVIVQARRRGPIGPIGVGFTASRKVGNAVIRNRAKRRLREAAGRLLPDLGLPGVDYILVARPSTAAVGWTSLLDDLGNALIRLRADLEGAPGARAKPRTGKPARKPTLPTESE